MARLTPDEVRSLAAQARHNGGSGGGFGPTDQPDNAALQRFLRELETGSGFYADLPPMTNEWNQAEIDAAQAAILRKGRR